MNFTFDINIPDAGPFAFILTQEPQSTDESVEEIGAVVSELPDSAFRSPGNRTAILSVLAEIDDLIVLGEIEQAIGKLENLRRRIDGCNGTPGELR